MQAVALYKHVYIDFLAVLAECCAETHKQALPKQRLLLQDCNVGPGIKRPSSGGHSAQSKQPDPVIHDGVDLNSIGGHEYSTHPPPSMPTTEVLQTRVRYSW